MSYGSKQLPTRSADRPVSAMAGNMRPDGVTEAVSNFYNGFLVFVFVVVSALAALVLISVVYQFMMAEYREQKDAWLLILVYVLVAYLAFVVSVGLVATFLSIRRHLVYHSGLLEIIARNGSRLEPAANDKLV